MGQIIHQRVPQCRYHIPDRVLAPNLYRVFGGACGDGEGRCGLGQIPAVDGDSGVVGALDPKESKTYGMFKQVMDWCAKVTRMQVRTNADTPEQTANAMAFGATGIVNAGKKYINR